MANINEIADYLMRPPPTPYDQVNPFDKFFDEKTARRKAKKEFDPYYREQHKLARRDRDRYMNRSQQDLTRALTDIGVREGWSQQDYNRALADIGVKEGWNQEDYNRALADIGVREGWTQEDFQTAQQEVWRGKARSLEDATTTIKRLGENRNVSRNLEDMNYNPLVENAMNSLALSGRTWGGRRGEVMGQLGQERDMRIGGINTEYQRGRFDTTRSLRRQIQDYDTQLKQAGTVRDRGLYGLGQERSGATTNYNRGNYGLGQERQATSTSYNRGNYGLGQERQDTKIGYRRSRQDYNTAYQRDTLARQRERRTALRGETERQRGIRQAEWDRGAQRYYANY